jgi:hypothetical protein
LAFFKKKKNFQIAFSNNSVEIESELGIGGWG